MYFNVSLKICRLKYLMVCALLSVFVISVQCRPNGNITAGDRDPEVSRLEDRGLGEPLFLTPYIEDGRLKEGRRKATVKPFVKCSKSYAGYLTVDKRYNSNLFFWYFESENDPENDPTVVWLQGGPGGSSLLGLFKENGPYVIGKDQKLSKRKHSWSTVSNIIYFDNPVGTGYSFTENDQGYATNETKVGRDLYEAFVQILKLFPRIQKNDVFITGESYAGKYIPAFGHTIHWKNKNNPGVHVNLKGMMIGNGFTDPIHMMIYSRYLYELGLIDDNARKKFHKKELQIIKAAKHHKWEKASKLIDMLVGDNSLYTNYTGFTSHFNYYNLESGDFEEYEQKFITGGNFRRHVRVGNKNYSDGTTVSDKLSADQAKSEINLVAELLNHYRVLFYNGQLDIICAYPLTVSYLRNMKWPLSHQYRTAKRHLYKVDGELAGYYKSVGNLTEVLVRDAGHMVPADQPNWSLHLLKDFLDDSIEPKTWNQN